jgi:hypothetical protein
VLGLFQECPANVGIVIDTGTAGLAKPLGPSTSQVANVVELSFAADAGLG